MSPKSIVLAVLAVALIAVGIIWLTVLREPAPPASRPPEPSEPVAAIPPARSTGAPPFFVRRDAPAVAPQEAPPTLTETASTNLLLDWEERVDQILTDDSEMEEKAHKMLELFPLMPEAGQIETAEHIANLLADADFDKFGRYLTNVQTSPAVQEIIFHEALNRPNSVKLPLLLQTARIPEHPMAEEAKNILELYVGEDHGTNWNKWQQEIERWLKENPD